VTIFSTITWRKTDRLQQSVVRICVIERWFHFPPHLSSATVLPWEITEHKITNLAVSNILLCEYRTLNNILFTKFLSPQVSVRQAHSKSSKWSCTPRTLSSGWLVFSGHAKLRQQSPIPYSVIIQASEIAPQCLDAVKRVERSEAIKVTDCRVSFFLLKCDDSVLVDCPNHEQLPHNLRLESSADYSAR